MRKDQTRSINKYTVVLNNVCDVNKMHISLLFQVLILNFLTPCLIFKLNCNVALLIKHSILQRNANKIRQRDTSFRVQTRAPSNRRDAEIEQIFLPGNTPSLRPCTLYYIVK